MLIVVTRRNYYCKNIKAIYRVWYIHGYIHGFGDIKAGKNIHGFGDMWLITKHLHVLMEYIQKKTKTWDHLPSLRRPFCKEYFLNCNPIFKK